MKMQWQMLQNEKVVGRMLRTLYLCFFKARLQSGDEIRKKNHFNYKICFKG